MDADTVIALLQEHLQDCQFEVSGEGANYDIIAIGDVFKDLRPVKQQQLVYAALGEHIADGRIHAVNISVYTPDQWRERPQA